MFDLEKKSSCILVKTIPRSSLNCSPILVDKWELCGDVYCDIDNCKVKSEPNLIWAIP